MPATAGPCKITEGICGTSAALTKPPPIKLMFCTGCVHGSKANTGSANQSYCRAASNTPAKRRSAVSVPIVAPKPKRTTTWRGEPHEQTALSPKASTVAGLKICEQALVELPDNVLCFKEVSNAMMSMRPSSTNAACTASGRAETKPQTVELWFTCTLQLRVIDGADGHVGKKLVPAASHKEAELSCRQATTWFASTMSFGVFVSRAVAMTYAGHISSFRELLTETEQFCGLHLDSDTAC
mmetsp:Transcript_81106/g.262737  ORF Transcript_81106/g.262737 Transcript_81106/m.262737 type:complete len:240 (-) Transcript_81106:567-1286(-)